MTRTVSGLLGIFPGDVYKSRLAGTRYFVFRLDATGAVVLRAMVPLHAKSPDVVVLAEGLDKLFELIEDNPVARYSRNSGGGQPIIDLRIGRPSVVGYNTGAPMVHIEVFGESALISPSDARRVALNLLSAAEAAEQDLCVFRFFTESNAVSVDTAVGIVRRMREFRHNLGERSFPKEGPNG